MSEPLYRAFETLHKARIVGYVSACFWTLAVILFFDGLQMLMRSDFNEVNVVVGGRVAMAGAMPLKVKEHSDIVVFIEGHNELIFTPHEHFKGLWFGAHMWRATLDASAVTRPGKAVLTVEDWVPAKSKTTGETIEVQNPSQIFNITVWPSKEAMQAAHLSFTRRVTGISPFIKAAVSLACGIALGIVIIRLNTAAHSALAQLGIFPILGIRKADTWYQAIFTPGDRNDVMQAQRQVTLLSPQGVELGKGVLVACSRLQGIALFPLDGPLRFGCLLRYEPDTNVVLESQEGDIASQ